MIPPIFSICAADSGVTVLLGSSPCRFYPFGDAPQNTTKPYAVWQQVGGGPLNCISDVPDTDEYSVQIDVYATQASAARAIAKAIRDAIEPHCHIVGWRGQSRDPDTKNYRISFDADWITNR
jgi:hypothetical protein